MTILSVVQDVATKIGLTVPSAVYAATTREMVEMKALITEVSTDIADAFDWQALQGIHTLTGDGAADDFALPSDYDRMLKDADLWSSQHQWEMAHITSSNDWLELQTVTTYTFTGGIWIIYGGEIHILDTMALNDTAKFFYISNKIVLAGSTPQVAFTADTETFRLSEKLLKKGLIYKWRASKGQPYAEDMADYMAELRIQIDKDPGSKPVIRGGRRLNRRDRSTVWPGTVSAAP
jgi:hypothetical protein